MNVMSAKNGFGRRLSGCGLGAGWLMSRAAMSWRPRVPTYVASIARVRPS
jgi:hypothetical protein